MPLEPDLAERIEVNFNNFTKSQRKIALFLMNNYETAAFLSAADLAAAVELSDATVIRFAQALNYNAFSELKSALRESIRLKLNPEVKVETTVASLGTEDIFRKVTQTEIGYLTEALETVRDEDILTAARWINDARKVFIMGYGVFASLVYALEFRLKRFGIDVINGDRGGRDFYEIIHRLTEEDCLLGFGFINPREEIVMALNRASEVGARRIVITDTPTSEIREISDIFIMARRGPIGVFHSLVVPSAIINTLILAVAVLEPGRCISQLERFSSLRKEMGYNKELGGYSFINQNIKKLSEKI